MNDPMKDAVDVYLGPAREQAERLYTAYKLPLEALMGECTSSEVEPGVWEYTFTPSQRYALSCALPRLSAVEAHKAMNSIMSNLNYSKSLHRVGREVRARKRKRRQQRAAFRRKKRGLA